MSEALASAPPRMLRLVPSRYPPVGLFDTVATAADLAAVMELAGWTNDRLVAERIERLPRAEWVYGRPNASVVMAAFLHVAPAGMRFNGAELGAWYAGADLAICAAEVGHHLRREAVSRALPGLTRTYRAYAARLEGDFVDIRNARSSRPELYAPDNYVASQAFGEAVRSSGRAGILYGSARLRGGVNAAAYRPSLVLDVVQAEHYRVEVEAEGRRIAVAKLG